MLERYVWIVVPIVLNVVWLVSGFFAGPGAWQHDGTACILMAFATSALAATLIVGFAVHDVGPIAAFFAMLTQTVVLIAIYTEIYSISLGRSLGDAFYYSVVTWTSLGYSDIVPAGSTKVVTATQSITGYVYLGLLVSVLSSMVGRERPAALPQGEENDQ